MSITDNVVLYYDSIRKEYHRESIATVHFKDETFDYNWALREEINGVSFIPERVEELVGSINLMKWSIVNLLCVDSKVPTTMEKRKLEHFDLSESTLETCIEQFGHDRRMVADLTALKGKVDRLVMSVISPRNESVSKTEQQLLCRFQSTCKIKDITKSGYWRRITGNRTKQEKFEIGFVLNAVLCSKGRKKYIKQLQAKLDAVDRSVSAQAATDTVAFASNGRKQWHESFTLVSSVWEVIACLCKYSQQWNDHVGSLVSHVKDVVPPAIEVGYRIMGDDVRHTVIRKRLLVMLMEEIQAYKDDLKDIKNAEDWDIYCRQGQFPHRDAPPCVDELGGFEIDPGKYTDTAKVKSIQYRNQQYQKLVDQIEVFSRKLPFVPTDEIDDRVFSLSFLADTVDFHTSASRLVSDLNRVVIREIVDDVPETDNSHCEEFTELIHENLQYDLELMCDYLDETIRKADVAPDDIKKYVNEQLEWLEMLNIPDALNQTNTLKMCKKIVEAIGHEYGPQFVNGLPGHEAPPISGSSMNEPFIAKIKNGLLAHRGAIPDHDYWSREIIAWSMDILAPDFKDREHRKTFMSVVPSDHTVQEHLYDILTQQLEDIGPISGYSSHHQYNMLTQLKQEVTSQPLISSFDEYMKLWYYSIFLQFHYLE